MMLLTKRELPAAVGPATVCADCCRQLKRYGYSPGGRRPRWYCRRCTIRRAVARGMPEAFARKRTA